MNLIESPWIPVLRENGEDCIAPWQITDSNNPVLKLATPRPDFNGALLQFLIGLLQTACSPSDGDQWADWLEQPPRSEILKEKFLPFVSAFELDGDGPRFMQDFSTLTGDPKPISSLLIDSPGAQTLKQNADHFIKRGGVEHLCPNCTATALFCLQTNAPSGGAGHRTSLRGGGPLSTLVALDPNGSDLQDDLWRACWLNVVEIRALSNLTNDNQRKTPKDIFPWLAPTRTSEEKTGVITTPLDTNPLQMYWGMPRRIRLDCIHTTEGDCDLCGNYSQKRISQYVTQNYGINYEGAWKHPLSPYLVNKDKEQLPQHAQPGGLNYRHWLGLVSSLATSEPAWVVRAIVDGNKLLAGEQLRLHVFGYDMDNMKARCWYETTFPLYTLDPAILERFTAYTDLLIQSATDTAGMVRSCIKESWFKRPGDAKGDTAFLIEAFFSHTETSFYTSLKRLKDQLETGEDGKEVSSAWHSVLSRTAIQLFDYWTGRGDFGTVNPRRIAQAHRKLNNWLYSKKLKQSLFVNEDKEKAA
ncbi:MAG: type I-E CRISPR-associated protein Cse1/CasA [Chromatiaceae bacterium]|nr:type I-E CRISPR-associated protein Cse1/CasA [Chromatiaceae bacterium]